MSSGTEQETACIDGSHIENNDVLLARGTKFDCLAAEAVQISASSRPALALQTPQAEIGVGKPVHMFAGLFCRSSHVTV